MSFKKIAPVTAGFEAPAGGLRSSSPNKTTK